MSLTVTASEASAQAFYMRVLVLTGATEAGGANVLAYGSTPNGSLTPNGTNSLPVWAIENSGSATPSVPVASNTALDSAAGSVTDSYTHGYYSGTVTAGTPVTVGGAAGSGAQMSCYEILSSGGSTPVQDGSAPVLATSATTSVTSAAFTPPAGSVLAALIACYDTAATPALTVTDSSGLTWTRRAYLNNFSQGLSAVYTATVTSVPQSVYPANQLNTGYQNAPGYPGSLTDGSALSLQSGHTYSFYNFPTGVGSTNFADGTAAHDVTFIGCRFASNSVNNANVHTVGPGMIYKYCTFEPNTVAQGSEPAISNPTNRIANANGYQYGILQDGVRGAVTVQNCRFWGFANAIQLDTSTRSAPFVIDTCLFQNARADGGTDHTDGPGQLTSSTSANYGIVRNCTILGLGNTNALALQAGTYNGWRITGNYFAGYNYMVSIGTVTGNQKNMIFANNRWGSDTSCEPALGPVYSNSVGSFPGTGQYGNYWYGNKMSTAAGTSWMAAGNNGLFWYPTDVNPAGPSSIIGHATDFQHAPDTGGDDPPWHIRRRRG